MPDPLDTATLAGLGLCAVLDTTADRSGWDVAAHNAGRILPHWPTGRPTYDDAALGRLLVLLQLGKVQVEALDPEGHWVRLPRAFWLSGWTFTPDADREGGILKTRDGPIYRNPRFGRASATPEAPERQHRRRGRKPTDSPEDISRGVELARINGGNFLQAARDLFTEKQPLPPDTPPSERIHWERERDRYTDRTRIKISTAYRAG